VEPAANGRAARAIFGRTAPMVRHDTLERGGGGGATGVPPQPSRIRPIMPAQKRHTRIGCCATSLPR